MFEILKLNLQGFSAYKIARKLDMDPPSVYESLKAAKTNFAYADNMLTELKALGWPTKMPEVTSQIRSRSPQSKKTSEIAIKMG
jgi:hypothetical protein